MSENRINNDFTYETDAHNWILYQWFDGNDKDGNPKRHKKTSYHGTLMQMLMRY